MKGLSKFAAGMMLFPFLMLLFFPPVFAQEQAPKAELPVMIASCGQSPGPMTLKLLIQRYVKATPVYKVQATAQDLAAEKKAGHPVKTLMIVTGASLKGMGGAGVDIQDELKRTKELIAEAKKQGILVIGAHIEGMARRAQGAAPGDNSDELSIDAVCPNADLLLVRNDGNADGRFTAIAKDKKIPLITYELNTKDLPDVLKKLFNKQDSDR